MSAVAQEKPTVKPGCFTQFIMMDGDTVPHMQLRQVLIFPPFKFKNKKQAEKFDRLRYNVKKVYPMAKVAGAKLREIDETLRYLKSESLKKFYLNMEEKKLKDEYEEELKKMSITQGRILVKLIDRETGKTTYAVVKELRGSFSAFLWQSVARLFGGNLKSQYDEEGEDKQIEQIIQLIENGQL